MALKSAECWYGTYKSDTAAHGWCEDAPGISGEGCQCDCHSEFKFSSETFLNEMSRQATRITELQNNTTEWVRQLRSDVKTLDQYAVALEERIKVLEQTGKPHGAPLGMAPIRGWEK